MRTINTQPDSTNTTAGTICAKDVAEHSSEILILCQSIDNFCQAVGSRSEEGGQTQDQASVDQELSQGDGTELQETKEPNTFASFLEAKNIDMKTITDKDT